MSFHFSSAHQSSSPSNGNEQYQLPDMSGTVSNTSSPGFANPEPRHALSDYNRGGTTDYNQPGTDSYAQHSGFSSTPSNRASETPINRVPYGPDENFDLPFTTLLTSLSNSDKDTLAHFTENTGNKYRLNPEQVKSLKRHIHVCFSCLFAILAHVT